MAVVAPLIEDKVTQRISALSMVANISTMLGLLGTVYGLIYALEGLDDASNIERTARLSAGIGAAMLTTAWGLIAGLPMMFAHNVLQRKSDCYLGSMSIISGPNYPSQQAGLRHNVGTDRTIDYFASRKKIAMLVLHFLRLRRS